jgi:hypothetical protein
MLVCYRGKACTPGSFSGAKLNRWYPPMLWVAVHSLARFPRKGCFVADTNLVAAFVVKTDEDLLKPGLAVHPKDF